MNQNPSQLDVNALQHFPFSSFNEFQLAHKNRKISIGVDRRIALLWTQPREKARHAPVSVRMKVQVLSALSYLTALFFAIFVVVEESLIWLAAIPILFVTFYIFQPSTEKVFFSGPRGRFILFMISTLIWFGLFYGIGFGINALTALAVSLLIQQHAIKRVHSVAINSLVEAVTASEDLFCRLWRNDGINIVFSNGDCFSNSFVSRDGH